MNFRHLAINKIVYLKLAAIAGFFILVALFSFFLWNFFTAPVTLNDEVKDFQKAGESALADLQALPVVSLIEEGDSYIVEDILSEGIEIDYPNQVEDAESVEAKKTKITLPKDYAKPIEIKLDSERTITLKDDNGGGFSSDVLTTNTVKENATWLQKILGSNKGESQQNYLRYQNGRKSILYSYQRDRATGERKLKNFIFYEEGTGEEQESYTVENASLKKNENGDIELFYQTEQDLKNQSAAKEVDPSLMDRAMKTLEKEGMSDTQKSPDLLIPKPYYYDKDGNYQEAEWAVDGSKLTLSIKTTEDKYPLAVDPTLAFTAPGIANGGVSIEGESVSDSFGVIRAADLNADGKTDLIVGAYGYSTSTGRVYIFYNDGNYSARAVGADVVITGEATNNYFGARLSTGDLNADGKTDLIVGAYGYSTSTGRVYVFYNDGTYTTVAASADVLITGQAGSEFSRLAIADLNADGEADLIVGADVYSGTTGRAYIFYGGSIVTETATSADIIINGESGYFGTSLDAADLNADGMTDLIVGASGYSFNNGRAYVFYADGTDNYGTASCSGTPAICSALNADVKITGSNTGDQFTNSIATGDFDADGRIDLAVGATPYSTNTGRAYIFYNDGSYPTASNSANVIITGETTDNYFGGRLSTGDFNADGKTDLVVGARGYSTNTGRAYIFYNDGSIPTTAGAADVIITGETTGNYFGVSLTTGDFNTDGEIDLAVGAYAYDSNKGKTYIFYSQNGVLNTNRNISGEATSYFGYALTTGDLNADGRVDLAVAAATYSTTGRVYVFYNDGSISTAASSADVFINGEASGNFGTNLAAADLNADGKTDLVAIDGTYASFGYTGRAYIFYNDGAYPTAAGSADAIITGEATTNAFGGLSLSGAETATKSITTGDFNTDGRVDLAIGARSYAGTGRVYIFYNGSITTENASGADVIITGETSSNLGWSLSSGDLNADGKVDLAVGTSTYSTTGRIYIFYNDGSIPTTAATADVIINGEASSNLGAAMITGDFNADGKTDLAVGDYQYSTTGRAYVFYNDGSYPSAAGSADVIITGPSSSVFGYAFAAADMNADGKTDLIIGDRNDTSGASYADIFYNGAITTENASGADVIINVGTITSGDGAWGMAIETGDINADGKADLIAADHLYSTTAGRVYFYEGRDNYSWTLQRQPLGTSRIQPSVMGEEIRITGEATNDQFGRALAAGDMNADGKTDLVVSAADYSGALGRVYIFYNDGNYPAGASSTDVVITGESSSAYFGRNLAIGDLNSDGKVDLVAGDYNYSSNTGRAYIFYNDGTYPNLAANADILITGNAGSDYFGISLATGDLNADGKVDLTVGAYGYTTSTGRAYIFYNGSIITEGASGADVTITGNATSDEFGRTMTTGDLNADGKTDLIVGATGYSSSTGRAYIFYGDGSIPVTAGTADVTITGEASSNQFATSLTTGDFNADGEVDLAVGAPYASSFGRTYIFNNDGSIPTTGATADVIITGDAFDEFGTSLASGDLNADGRVDLVVGIRYAYPSDIGRAYIFYNDGTYPSGAASADVTITGEQSEDWFSKSLITGDFNADGKIDLAVGAPQQTSGYQRGKVYMYTMNDAVTAGGATGDQFGFSVASGDLNADGKVDLAVGADLYSSSTGRVYVFYGGSAQDVSPSTADAIITGAAAGYRLGSALAVGDLNADGKVDLAVGSEGHTVGGRAYIFYNGSIITENATGADVNIAAEGSGDHLGVNMAMGDLNADSKNDLVIGASQYSSSTGRAYIFYGDGTIPTSAGTADIIITGEASSAFGYSLATGDLNADGEVDLAVGAKSYSSATGRVYIFYNDGTYPSAAGSSDVMFTGQATNEGLGVSLATGDLNADGKVDLAVGSALYFSATGGRVYVFYNDGSYPATSAADATIESTDAVSMALYLKTGDLNADGRTDLIVSAQYDYPGGSVYVFYNDGSYPSLIDDNDADKIYNAGTADLQLGAAFDIGDFNGDGISDLVVGAPEYSSSTGRAYTFITEIAPPQAAAKTPDGNEITASVKGGTIKVKGGTIQVK